MNHESVKSRPTPVFSLLLCLSLPLLSPPASGQEVSRFNPERLSRIDQVLQDYVDSGQLAGAVALVLHNGEPVYEHAVGWADKETQRPMSPTNLFRIASQTKALTSVVILSLMEEGKLNLNDPVSRFIPEWANTTVAEVNDGVTTIVPARRQINIRDLLTHTAGISYGTQSHIADLYREKLLGPAAGMGWYTADKDEPVCTTMETLATLPFVSQPGEAWVYGYNTDVLGCVAERAAGGVLLDELIRSRITEPLQMHDTRFFVPTAERERLVTVYASDSESMAVRAAEGSRGQGHYVDGPRRNFAGGAGLTSTVRDYGRFLEMIRNGGQLDGVRILSPRSVALMTTNQVGTLHSANGLGFGLGFETTDRYGASNMEGVGSYGWGGAYGSVYRVDPQAGIAIMLMVNQLPLTSDIRIKFPTMVYQALE